MATPLSMPLPPPDLAYRVHASRDVDSFDQTGRLHREAILSMLPADWTWQGKRVLDFGCGVGRTARHFLGEAEQCELWGCDIDGPSIDWLDQHLCPPLNVVLNGERPPLAFPDGHFDLVIAISVFTHLTDSWAEWLAELQRVTRDGGLLIATYHGPAARGWIPWWNARMREPSGDDRAGMAIVSYSEPFADSTGPGVHHSPWWIEEHWGRAFDILENRPSGFAVPDADQGQGVALMKRRNGRVRPPDLERVDPSDARELEALRFQIRLLLAETAEQRQHIVGLRERGDRLETVEAERDELRSSAAGLKRNLELLTNSRSWRLTAPLRGALSVARRLGRRTGSN